MTDKTKDGIEADDWDINYPTDPTEDEVKKSVDELVDRGLLVVEPTIGDVPEDELRFRENPDVDHQKLFSEWMAEDDEFVIHRFRTALYDEQPPQDEVPEFVFSYFVDEYSKFGVNPARVMNRNIEKIPIMDEPFPEEYLKSVEDAA